MTLPNTHLFKHRLELDASASLMFRLARAIDNEAMPYDPHRLAVARRLAIAIKDADITHSDLAAACGDLSISAVGDWLKTGRIHPDRFPYISKAVNRSELWLRIGLEPESIAMAEVHESLPKEEKVTFQKVGHSLAQSAQLIPWKEGDPDRRSGGGQSP